MLKKQKRERKLYHALAKEKNFLLERMRQEWDEAEHSATRAEKHAELMRYAKASTRVVGQSLLALLALAGVATVSVIAPNIFAAVGDIGNRKRFYERKSLSRSITYLKKKQYVRGSGNGRYGYRLELTDRGADIVCSHAFSDLRIKPTQRWDGYWHLVIFDIPDRHKWARETFHRQLKTMGLYPMQKSVFGCPYPCSEEVRFVIQLLDIQKYVRLITTRHIDPDGDMRDVFFSDS